MNLTPETLLNEAINRNVSDLHLNAGYPPTIRNLKVLVQLTLFPTLDVNFIHQFFVSFTTKGQQEAFYLNKELDFSIVYNNIRFRVNTYYEKNAIAISLRLIPTQIKTLDDLNLPTVLTEIIEMKQGLVLITGQTGQGKSTTLSSIINQINLNRPVHIVTIEDPIEFIYSKGKAIVSQRELKKDTLSFSNALRSVLREDADIIVVGEMRDFETISSAITLAETGHLVFSTLHTNTAGQTIDRIIDVFPEEQQPQISAQLANVLKVIVCQKLLPSLTAETLVPACELLFNNAAIASLIREKKTYQIDNVIQTSASEKMIIFEQYLKELYQASLIAKETALKYALRPKLITELLR